jgi:hypothetical protein
MGITGPLAAVAATMIDGETASCRAKNRPQVRDTEQASEEASRRSALILGPFMARLMKPPKDSNTTPMPNGMRRDTNNVAKTQPSTGGCPHQEISHD